LVARQRRFGFNSMTSKTALFNVRSMRPYGVTHSMPKLFILGS